VGAQVGVVPQVHDVHCPVTPTHRQGKLLRQYKRQEPPYRHLAVPCIHTVYTKEDWFCTHIGWRPLRTASALASSLHFLVSTCLPSPPTHRVHKTAEVLQLHVYPCYRCSLPTTASVILLRPGLSASCSWLSATPTSRSGSAGTSTCHKTTLTPSALWGAVHLCRQA